LIPAQAAAAGRQRGFTLLEVLVAFIIAALALAALLQGSAAGLQNARVAAHYQEAIARARSRLAALTADMRGGEQSGDDGGGFTYRVAIQPGPSVAVARPPPLPRPGAPSANPPNPAADRTVLYDVTVAIGWNSDGSPRQVALSTRRLGLAPPEPP
jgi:general secretion pathway protein I